MAKQIKSPVPKYRPGDVVCWQSSKQVKSLVVKMTKAYYTVVDIYSDNSHSRPVKDPTDYLDTKTTLYTDAFREE